MSVATEGKKRLSQYSKMATLEFGSYVAQGTLPEESDPNRKWTK